ncbi:hypothetical protein RHSIM_Rhsim09G0097500 [Rhododendron simsii]|uniref:Homeobox domain-containing protein n=1 Tax=Rhododendron simsii TaxID=118357 RepID=A0A834LF54_RHOSS|nr:hypothetical protein RHSIM_Rhsim09G0097500 [Rhododendron simsii]
MAVSPTTSTCLELTISMPGSAVSHLPSSEERGGQGVMRNLDINQVPSEEDCWTGVSVEIMDDYDDGNNNGGGPPRKKLRLTKEQYRLLEESFRHNHTLNPKQKEALAMQLKLMPRQVEVWFQNRRARSKLKQTEMECEYLKRWFGSLTEQNRQLQKEVEELRAMKVGPAHSCDPPLPASALSMCPRCERVTATTDKGPTSWAAATATTTTKPATMSSKVPPMMRHSRHPSAAC